MSPLKWFPLAISIESFKLFLQTLKECFCPPLRVRETFTQLAQLTTGSLPVIVISTTFSSIILTNEIAWHMNQALHTVTMIPGFSVQFILREFGIAIPAVFIISKVGASMTAEIGSMKITDQLDALKLLGIRPIHYLVVPRFLACLIGVPCLTLIALFVSVLGSILLAVTKYSFNPFEFLNAVRNFITIWDLITAASKSLVYGAMIPIIACSLGFRCEGGAQGVGTATTLSVVTNTVGLILFDFIMTYLFSLIL